MRTLVTSWDILQTDITERRKGKVPITIPCNGFAKSKRTCSEEDFFPMAVGIPPRMEGEPSFPVRAKRPIQNILTHSLRDWILQQSTKFKQVRRGKDDFTVQEPNAKEDVPPEIRKSNHKKQTIFAVEPPAKIKYSDMDVVHRCLTGFPLIGTMPEVPIFEQRKQANFITASDPI